MTNTIRLKITCFLLLFTVLLIKGILDLAWHLATRMKFGTCEQNWDLYGTISGLSPKFGTSFKALFLLFGFFIFRDQIFRNRDRDFFPRPNFLKPNPRLFFWNQNRNPQRFGKSFDFGFGKIWSQKKSLSRFRKIWSRKRKNCVCHCVSPSQRKCSYLNAFVSACFWTKLSSGDNFDSVND